MHKHRLKLIIISVVLALAAVYLVNTQNRYTVAPPLTQDDYNPVINPSDFTTTIDNPYFSLPIGKIMVYESETADGLERIEIEIKPGGKTLMGVETVLYHDRVYVDNILVEDTRDYLAQDKEGNVWYFGEDVDNYIDGKLADHEGSWLAGVNGALPGIWFKANPTIGDSYRQEYLPGEAEDMVDIVGANETVKVDDKEYVGCIKTYDWTPLDPDSKEFKYYCPEVSSLVMVEHIIDEESTYLVSVTTP